MVSKGEILVEVVGMEVLHEIFHLFTLSNKINPFFDWTIFWTVQMSVNAYDGAIYPTIIL